MRVLWLASLVVAACAAAPLAQGVPQTATVERRLGMMGTELELSVEAADRAAALDASEVAVRALEAAEARLSTWRDDSELARLNRTPVDVPLQLSPPLLRELRSVQHWWRETGGAFDPGIGALIAAWGLRTGGRVPSLEEREKARASGGLAALELDAKGRAVRRRPGLRIEEGGWGKGAGLDAAIEALRQDGHATAAMLNLGGQVEVYGPGRWTLALADPRDRQHAVVALTVSSGSVATSGNSEHGFERDGVRYGHLLDPATGAPARDFGSLTVWAPEALAADCLSKLYVRGPDAAFAWARAHAGVEVLTLETLAGGLRARASAGWRGRLEALVPELKVEFESGAPGVPASQAGEPPSLTQLEKEIAALRAEVQALRAQSGPDAERLRELERQLQVLAQEIETLKLGEAAAATTADRSTNGMGPAASKIYRSGNGLAIGGYGEGVYRHFAGKLQDGSPSTAVDEADLQRAVLYFGYKFNDRFLFNSELEIEHAVTASDKGGETEVEFAYGDYLWKPQANLRAGLVLMPVGLLNEYHEPTVFFGMSRNGVETAIIPTTWREIGFGLYGEAGPWRYRAYLTNGLDASRFAADGLREGQGEGSHAKAEDLAWVGRLDYTGVPGLLIGGSAFTGDSGQGLLNAAGQRIGGRVTLYEGHVDWRWRGLQLRALGVRSHVDDVAEIDQALGLEGEEGIGKAQKGAYAEVGFDLLSLRPGSRQRLIPFARYESFDTQSEVPAGFVRDPANDARVLTLGVNYYPIDQLVVKANVLRVRNEARTGQNELQIGLGYVF